jgi:hypothetical protein
VDDELRVLEAKRGADGGGIGQIKAIAGESQHFDI